MVMNRRLSSWMLRLLFFCLCGIVCKSSCSTIEDTVESVTSTLKREIEGLQEKIEAYEMKHDTLEAATEQFRLKAKSLKQKLDEEKERHDAVAAEKLSLEEEFEARLENALKAETEKFNSYKEQQTIAQRKLQEKIDELQGYLETLQQQYETTKVSMSEKMADERDVHKLLEMEKNLMEKEFVKEKESLAQQLNETQRLISSLEETLNATLARGIDKDVMHQKELRRRTEEGNDREAQIKQLKLEATILSSTLKKRESELSESQLMVSILEGELESRSYQLKAAEGSIRELMTNQSKTEDELWNIFTSMNDASRQFDLVDTPTLSSESRENVTNGSSRVMIEVLSHNRDILSMADRLSKKLQQIVKEHLQVKQELLSAEEKLNLAAMQSSNYVDNIGAKETEFDDLYRKYTSTKTRFSEKSEALEQCSRDLGEMRKVHSHISEAARNETLALRIEALAKNEVLARAHAKCAELEMIALQNNRDLAEVRTRYETMAANLEAAKKRLLEAKEFSTEIQAALDVREEELKHVKMEYQKAEELITQQASDLLETRAQLADLISKRAQMEQQLEESSSRAESCTNRDDDKQNWMEKTKSSLRWLDYKMYQGLRLIMDVLGCLMTRIPKDFYVRSINSPVSAFQGIHCALLTSFQWVVQTLESMAVNYGGQSFFASCIRTSLDFLDAHRHFVVIGFEGIATLLCVDFLLSSILYRGPIRKERVSTSFPEEEVVSLLRKARNFPK